MALIVQKFGGSSLAGSDRLCAVANLIAECAKQGNQVVAVLSARGKTTDRLLAEAAEFLPDPAAQTDRTRRELDQLLSCGEQASVALCALALQARGVAAVSLTGWQAGLFTDGVYQNAWPRQLISDRIHRELAKGQVVLVAGFQGLCADGDTTTLGRGGSDTTAVALCHYLGAHRCRIYTDVDGVYTADPHLDPTAQKLKTVDYDRMLAMAQNGAKVLHDRSVALAKAYGIEIEVLSSFTGTSGTTVTAAT